MQLHATANMLVLQPWDPHTVDNWRRELKWIQFFFSFLEDIISRWAVEAVNSSQTPTPIRSVWRQIHWFPVSQWTCKGHFLYENGETKKEKKENPLHFLCFFNMHFKIAAVLLCFIHKWWFEFYAVLNEKRWSSIGQSVFSQKPETIMPLQCSYVDRSFPCYSFF